MFTVDHILNAGLVCADNEVVFVGSVLHTDGYQDTDIMETLEDFKSQDGMLNITGVVLEIDDGCSTVVMNGETYPCLADNSPAATNDSPNMVFIIAICVAVGVLVIIVVLINIMTVAFCRHKKRRRPLRKKGKYGMPNSAAAIHGLSLIAL